MVKLSFIDSDFIQNGNVTVCKLICSFRESAKGDYMILPGELCEKYKLGTNGKTFIVIGKSVRHPEDEDNNTGFFLAESRAKKKAYKKSKAILKDYVKIFEREFKIKEMNSCIEKLEKLENTEDSHILNLTTDEI